LQYNRDPAQILLRWSLQKGYFSASEPFHHSSDCLLQNDSFVPLPKSATPERIHSNARLYDFALDADDMTALDGLDKGTEGAISWNPVNFP
jgi:diketogulonate reductase-like aldo/keto reductase